MKKSVSNNLEMAKSNHRRIQNEESMDLRLANRTSYKEMILGILPKWDYTESAEVKLLREKLSVTANATVDFQKICNIRVGKFRDQFGDGKWYVNFNSDHEFCWCGIKLDSYDGNHNYIDEKTPHFKTYIKWVTQYWNLKAQIDELILAEQKAYCKSNSEDVMSFGYHYKEVILEFVMDLYPTATIHFNSFSTTISKLLANGSIVMKNGYVFKQ